MFCYNFEQCSVAVSGVFYLLTDGLRFRGSVTKGLCELRTLVRRYGCLNHSVQALNFLNNFTVSLVFLQNGEDEQKQN